jgi:hypothetical protein
LSQLLGGEAHFAASILLNIIRETAMKTISLALLLMASMAFVLGGCTDKSEPILAPTDQIESPNSEASLAKHGCVVHSIIASTRTRVNEMGAADKEGKILAVMTLKAWGFQDGKGYGEFDLEQSGQLPPYGGKEIHGKIVQLSVAGNKGKVMFEITKGYLVNGMSLAGQIGCIVGIDNSARRHARLSDYWSAAAIDVPQVMKDMGFWEMSPDEFISAATAAGFPSQPIDKGNILVR